MRYEVAVRTTLGFHTQERPYPDGMVREPETVVIEFGGRRFVWHVIEDEHQEWFPTVTTMVADPADPEPERLAMERFFSAVSWWTGRAIDFETGAGAGVPREMDPPVAHALRAGLGPHIHEAPHELVVVDDPALRRVLAYHRDGLNTGSAFFRFLAFYNALDIACEDYAGTLPAWFRATMARHPHLRRGNEPPPPDWWDYLQNERRHAVAHAVRDRPGPELDPDDPNDRQNLWRDANLLHDLVQMRVRERWGDHPVWQRRRRN